MNTEEKKKYFAEAALALNREGFHAEMFHGGKLSVWWDGEPLCEISDGSVVHYHNADLQTPERNEAKDKKAFNLYRGPLFQSAQDEHWLLSQVNHYRLCYVALVNELLDALVAAKDYVCVQHYAAEALRVMPGNLKAHFWLIDAMQHLGTVELAKRELAKAKDTLTEEEYEVLTSYFKEDTDISTEELFAPIQRPK